jgi:hypothetical protein
VFLFIEPNLFTIGTASSIFESERTVDINVKQLAKNQKLLRLLTLVSDFSNNPKSHEFFCGYLASFYDKPFLDVLALDSIRILFENDLLRKQFVKEMQS